MAETAFNGSLHCCRRLLGLALPGSETHRRNSVAAAQFVVSVKQSQFQIFTYPLQAQGHSVAFPIIVSKYSHFLRLYSHFPHFQQIRQPEELREAFPRPSLPAGRDRVSAAESACGQGPCFRVRVCLRAGTSDRCAPAVLSLPPLRCGPLTVHEATGGYAVRSPCPSGIPRPRDNASALGLQGLP